MKLEHPNLAEFEPLVRELYKIAFTTGWRFLDKEGIKKLEELNHSNHLHNRFIKYCHRGYDTAQKDIAKELISLHELKTHNEELLKEARLKHDKEKIISFIELRQVIDNRVIVLRRIMDTIAFTLFRGRVWLARRFILNDKEIKKIDIAAIKSNLKEASWLNNMNRLSFSLVSDMTTFIDVGDLLQADFGKSPKELSIIELKSGTINKMLIDIIDVVKENKEIFNKGKINDFRNLAEGNVAQQLKRMMRQQERMEDIIDVAKNSSGKDIQSGEQIYLTENEISTGGYKSALDIVIRETRLTGYSFHRIDNCLYVVATKDGPTSAYHLIYHLMNHEQPCALNSNNEFETKKEFENIKDIARNPFIVNFANHNMYAKSSTPIFVYSFGDDALMDMLFDRLTIVLYLDISKFKELCSTYGYKFELSSRKETNKMVINVKRSSVPLLDNKLIKLTSPEGLETFLFGGTFHKIFFDLINPSELLRVMRIADKEFTEKLKSKQ